MKFSTPVQAVMTTNVISISPDSPMTRVREIFNSHTIHHIPVTGPDLQVLGIISKQDFMVLLDRKTLSGDKAAVKKNKELLASLHASDIMIRNVATIRAEDSIDLGIRVFLENEFHALPVVDSGKLVGIITAHDMLEFLYEKEVRNFLNR